MSTIEQHHASLAVGSTMLRCFQRSKREFYLRYIEGSLPPESVGPAADLGQAFHTLILEPETFEERYAVMPEECAGDGRTKAVKQAREAFELEHADKHPLTPSDFIKLCRMRDSLMEHPAGRPLIEAQGETELSHEWDQNGVRCKVRFDKLVTVNAWGSPLVLDLKTTPDASRRAWGSKVRGFRYDIQAGLYLLGAQSYFAIGEAEFAWPVVSTEQPYLSRIYQLEDWQATLAKMAAGDLLTDMAHCYETANWRDEEDVRIITCDY